MQYAHNIKITVFCKKEDNENKIKDSLLKLLSFVDLEKEKIKINEEECELSDNTIMKIFSIILSKKRHTTQTIIHLMNLLDINQKQFLLETIDTRLDKEMNFFYRLDKTKLLEDKLEIIDGGDCFHVKISIAAYPAKTKVAKRVVKEFLR